jgi:nuclease S1
MKRTLFAGIIAALILGGATNNASAWGGDGHRIVAAIAFKLLPPDKANALDQLLQQSLVDRDFVDAASYADEVIRAEDHANKFGPWHFVDWEDDGSDYSDNVCKPDCIIRELPEQINKAKAATNRDDKALALSWIIHLMGDLHQPLHVSDRQDRGGNEFAVMYRHHATCRKSSTENGRAKVELHSVWDTCLVVELENGESPTQFADRLRAGRTTWHTEGAANGQIMDWAKDTHQLAHSTAFDSIQNGADLGDTYIDVALPVVRDQLFKAGVRLARILDENF